MRNAYLETLYDIAMHDKNVFAMISDNGAIVYDKYRQDLPDQYINSGIAEASMVAMAAGMASRGKVPFAYTIGAFLSYRAFEFIRNDVCLQNQNVKIVGTGAGCVYSVLGPTHHTTEDISCLRALPNLTLFSPASPKEVKKVVRAAYELQGPVYIRLGTNRELEIYEGDFDFVVGKGVGLREGNDVTIVGTGSIVHDIIQAAEILQKESISAQVINIHTIKPFDRDIIINAAKMTRRIVAVEEHNVIGGLGSAVAEVIAEENLDVKLIRVGLDDKFAQGYGTHSEVKAANGIGIYDICQACR